MENLTDQLEINKLNHKSEIEAFNRKQTKLLEMIKQGNPEIKQAEMMIKNEDDSIKESLKEYKQPSPVVSHIYKRNKFN